MRRLMVGSVAFAVLTGMFLVLPVYAAPTPAPRPVAAATDTVPLGSVTAPAEAADVQRGTSAPVAGVAATAPTLTITRNHTRSFSLVGVTWKNDPGVTDTVVDVRVKKGDGAWGDWTQVDIEDAEQNPNADSGAVLRGGTEPLWTGPSTGVDVELVTRSGTQPTDVKLDLVDPGTSPADKTPGKPAATDQAHAAAAMPPVYSRAQWGADESIRTWDPEYASTIKAATIHHTDDTNSYTADQVPAMLRAIYQFHAVGRGWGDIGYNVIADKFGRLWEGRYGGIASTVIAAHAGGFNTYTFGVSLLGNYDEVDTPAVMIDAVSAFIAWKFSLYGVDPYGSTTLVSAGGGTAKYAAGVPVRLPTIFGHRDVGNTICPGQYAYAKLAQIRQKVADRLGASDTPQISDHYDSDPALQALLGAKTGYERQSAGVVWQPYEGGALFYSPATGVKYVHGGVLAAYLAAGGPASMGAPTVEETPTPDGRGVEASFQQADIYWTPTTDAHVVRGAVREQWTALGATSSWLGYPTTDEQVTSDGHGVIERFERGIMMWSSASGAQPLVGAVQGAFEASGREAGPMGYPVGAETDGPGGRGRVQEFQRGSIYWTPTTGADLVYGGVGEAWTALGGAAGPYGFPTESERSAATAGGRSQTFETGRVVWKSGVGAYGVTGSVQAAWNAAGAEAGAAGYPVSEETALADGQGHVQRFQSGSIYWTSTDGAHLVRGGIGETWLASGGTSSPLGYPTSDEQNGAVAGSRVQQFDQGAVYWSWPAGAHVVRGDIGTEYDSVGGAGGILGLPTTEAVAAADGTGRIQRFQGGSIYWSSASGAHVVRAAVADSWLAAGGPTGPLGYPTADETNGPVGGSRVQEFEHGHVYWSWGTGPHVVRGDIETTYDAAGGAGGYLGLPTGDAVAAPDRVGVVQAFAGGSVYWTSGTGAHVVHGAIGFTWLMSGGPTSRLGYPLGEEIPTGTGTYQKFQHGTVTWTAATGATAVTYS